MKKLICILMAFCLLLTAAACGASGQTQTDSSAPGTSAPETVAPETSAPAANAPEASAPEASAPETTLPAEEPTEAETGVPTDNKEGGQKWRQDYAETLERLAEDPDAAEYSQYALYDLDGDRVPELLVKAGSSEAVMELRAYAESPEGVVPAGTVGAGNAVICGYAEEGTLLIHNVHMGYESVSKLILTGEGFETESVVSGRELGEGEEYLPLEPLRLWGVTDAAGLDWTENPQDGNWEILQRELG